MYVWTGSRDTTIIETKTYLSFHCPAFLDLRECLDIINSEEDMVVFFKAVMERHTELMDS